MTRGICGQLAVDGCNTTESVGLARVGWAKVVEHRAKHR